MAGLRTVELRNPASIPGRNKIFFSPPEMSRPALGPPQLLSIEWVPGVFPRLKWLKSELNHLILTRIEGTNVWSYTSTLLCAFMTSMQTPLPK